MRSLAGLGIALLVLWIVLWLGLRIVGVAIHLLLLAGIALLIWALVRRGAGALGGGES